MIGTIDIKVQAASPNIPLAKMRAFVGSPSNVRVRNVPREIGEWEITQVFVTANYPDNTSRSVECVQTAGIYVATLPASSVAGTSANGYTVTANGVDENGAAVTGYILGKGDIEIINADGTITPGETTFYIHLLTAAPTTPHKGDAYVDAGSWKVYDGTQWVALGGISAAGQYVQAPTAQGGDGKWHRVIIADGALAFDDEGVNEPPEAASKVWVGQQVAAEATARGTAITQAVAAEASSRSAADTAEATARREADEGEAAARAAAVSAEVTARQNADTALGGRIDAEASSRSAADTALGGRIDAEATSRAAADTANASAITALQSQTAGTAASGLKSAIEAEAARAEGAEGELNDAIVAEAARAAAAEAQAVHKTGNESVGGVKSFSTNPEVPLLNVADDTAKAVSSAWVVLKLAHWWSAIKQVAQTITGVWSFSSSPVVPTPTSDGHAANKAYADTKAADNSVVKISGNQSIDGVKSFNSDIVSARTGSSACLRSRFTSMARGDSATYGKTAAVDLEDKDALMLMRFAMSAFTADGRRVANILGYLDDGTSVELASFALYPDGSVRPGGAALASACMPSGTWTTPIDGASIVNGATYTADRNGYLVIRGTSTSARDMINIQDNYTLLANKVYAQYSDTMLMSWLPILAGRTYTIYISGNISNLVSRFVRAEANR